LLGYLFNWGLYGALVVQVYIYHIGFSNDRAAWKVLVGCIFVFETAQTILMTHDVFKTFAEGYGNLAALNSTQLVWLAVPILGGIVSCCVQIFYAYRIYVISSSKVIAIVITLLALMQGSAAIAQGVEAAIIGNFTDLQARATMSCSVWLAGSAACDVIIAASMSYFVSGSIFASFLVHSADLSKNKSTFSHTQALVTQIIRLIIETGTFTATIAILDLVLFIAFPRNDYHTTPAFMLGKLHSNTLLVIFNSRLSVPSVRSPGPSLQFRSHYTASREQVRDIGEDGRQQKHAVFLPQIRQESMSGGNTVRIGKEFWSNF
ncbi:hypothetical protein BDQ12DRAFT_607194, partial [Crucibulum laeve]